MEELFRKSALKKTPFDKSIPPRTFPPYQPSTPKTKTLLPSNCGQVSVRQLSILLQGLSISVSHLIFSSCLFAFACRFAFCLLFSPPLARHRLLGSAAKAAAAKSNNEDAVFLLHCGQIFMIRSRNKAIRVCQLLEPHHLCSTRFVA